MEKTEKNDEFFLTTERGAEFSTPLATDELKSWCFDGDMVRSIVINGELYFNAKDAADILGYDRTVRITEKIDDDEIVKYPIQTNGGVQEMFFVTESGLYHAIFNSTKPAAREFRRWITGTVLPAIRQHGFFATEDAARQLAAAEQKALQLMLAGNRYIIENIEEIGRKKLLPQKAVKEIASWNEGSNALSNFASETARIKFFFARHCDIVNAGHVLVSELYALYGKWCDGVFASERLFIKGICGINNRLIDYREKMVQGERTWVFAGIALKNTAPPAV